MRQLRHMYRPRWRGCRKHGHRPGSRQVDDYGTVIKYIKVLYCQNVLRSANKIDQNMDDPIEIIGEGQAFWRILAPWMTAHSDDAAKIFDRMFSTRAQPPGCQQLQLLHRQEVHRLVPHLPSWAPPTLRPPLLAASMKFPPA